jgi:hypothetical protein
MDKFNPKEGDRILVGWSEDKINEERTYLFTDKNGMFFCVAYDYEVLYLEGKYKYHAVSWPYAKPLPSKLPEFIDGDPVVVWGASEKEHIRIVDSTNEDGRLMCYSNGRFSGSTTGYSHYKPFHNYDYGGRDVWGSEDRDR